MAKVIYNKILPFKGFYCINLFGLLFVRRTQGHALINKRVLNHESIHSAQMKELGYVGFYLIYALEWLYRLVFHTKTAYSGLSFEVEAYANEIYDNYLVTRKHYAQWRKK